MPKCLSLLVLCLLISARSRAANPPAFSPPGNGGYCVFDGGKTNCWGPDLNGVWEREERRNIPQLVSPKSLSSFDSHHCALDEGKLKCWGPHLIPNQRTFKNLVGLKVNRKGFCVIDEGKMRCEHALDSGSLPQPLPSVSHVSLSTDSGTLEGCAISRGTVRCWDSMGKEAVAPTLIHATEVAYGRYSSCAVDSGRLVCWNNDPKHPDHFLSQVPKNLKAPHGITLNPYGNEACVIDEGKAICWGATTPPTLALTDKVSEIRGTPGSGFCALGDFGVRCLSGSSSVTFSELIGKDQSFVGAARFGYQYSRWAVCVTDKKKTRCNEKDWPSYVPREWVERDEVTEFAEVNDISNGTGKLRNFCVLANQRVSCIGDVRTVKWIDLPDALFLIGSKVVTPTREGTLKLSDGYAYWQETSIHWETKFQNLSHYACNHHYCAYIDNHRLGREGKLFTPEITVTDPRGIALTDSGEIFWLDGNNLKSLSAPEKSLIPSQLPLRLEDPRHLAIWDRMPIVVDKSGLHIGTKASQTGEFGDLTGLPLLHEKSRGIQTLTRDLKLEDWIPPLGTWCGNLPSLFEYLAGKGYQTDRLFLYELSSRFREATLPMTSAESMLGPVLAYVLNREIWYRPFDFSKLKKITEEHRCDFPGSKYPKNGFQRRIVSATLLHSLLTGTKPFLKVDWHFAIQQALAQLEAALAKSTSDTEWQELERALKESVSQIATETGKNTLVSGRKELFESALDGLR